MGAGHEPNLSCLAKGCEVRNDGLIDSEDSPCKTTPTLPTLKPPRVWRRAALCEWRTP